MKKLILIGAILCSMAITTACGESTETKKTPQQPGSETTTTTPPAAAFDDAKAKELAQALVDGGIFEGEMAEVDASIVQAKYELDDTVTCITAYRNASMNPEEITILKSSESPDSLIDAYLDTQKTSYDSYMPEEVKKIEHVIRKTSGEYTVVIVCNDTDKAETILKDYFG